MSWQHTIVFDDAVPEEERVWWRRQPFQAVERVHRGYRSTPVEWCACGMLGSVVIPNDGEIWRVRDVAELANNLREIPCPRCHPDTASELEQITTLQALAKNPARLQEMAVLCDAAMDKGDLGPMETWHNPDDTQRIEVLEQHNKKLIDDLLHFETQLALAQHHLLRNGIGPNGEDLDPDDGEEDSVEHHDRASCSSPYPEIHHLEFEYFDE